MIRRLLFMLMALLYLTPSATSEVTDSADGGFAVTHSVTVKMSPDVAFREFINVGNWWSSAHTWSGDAANMSIEPTPRGAFLEKLPNGGFVRHLDIVFVAPGEMIRLQGGLGPLQEYAVNGTMTVKFVGMDDGTKISVTYNVGGYVKGGLKNWAAPVDQVVCEQFDRLKMKIEGTLPEK